MCIYAIALITSYIFMLVAKLIEGRSRIFSIIFAVVSYISVWSISAIRYGVGTDFFNYYIYINRLNLTHVRNNEYGIWIVANIIKLFTSNGQIFIAICSFIILGLIFYTIKSQSLYPEISVVLFIGLGYYFTSFNILRQYIALSLVFFAAHYLLDNKKIIFVILILVATTFHLSAIICLVFIPICNMQQKIIKIKRIIVALSVLLYLFYDKILNNIFIGDYGLYNNTRFIREGASYTLFFLYLIITIIILCFNEKLITLNKNNQLYILLILIGTSIVLLGTKSLIIVRISEYFTIFTILVLPDLIRIIKDKYLRLITYLSVLIVSILGWYLFLSRNLGEVLPYETFF